MFRLSSWSSDPVFEGLSTPRTLKSEYSEIEVVLREGEQDYTLEILSRFGDEQQPTNTYTRAWSSKAGVTEASISDAGTRAKEEARGGEIQRESSGSESEDREDEERAKVESLPHIGEHDVLYRMKEGSTGFVGEGTNLIFVTSFIPFKFNEAKSSLATGELVFDEDYTDLGYNFYYIRKILHKENRFPWIGLMVLKEDQPLREAVRDTMIEDYGFWPVFITEVEYKCIFKRVWKRFLSKIFGVNYVQELEKQLEFGYNNFDEDWKILNVVSERIVDEIINCQAVNEYDPKDPKSLVVINGLMCLLLPRILISRRIKLNMGFYFHSPFPCLNYLRRIANYREIIKGILSCDVIYFNVHQQAGNFLQVLKDLFFLDITYELNGYISVAYKGRKIYIRILILGVHSKKIGFTHCTASKIEFSYKIKHDCQGKVVLLSIEQDDFMSLKLKLNILESLLESYPELLDKLSYTIIASKYFSRSEESGIQSQVEILNSKFGNVLKVEFKSLRRYEKWAYMEQSDIFLEVSIKDRVNIYCLEFAQLKQDCLMMIDKSSYINPMGYTGIEIENPLKVKSFCAKLNSLIQKASRIDKTNTPQKKKGINHIDSQPIYNIEVWWKMMSADLKKAAIEQSEAHIKFKEHGDKKDLSAIATPKNYMRADMIEIWQKVLTKSGFIFVDFDSLFISGKKVVNHIFHNNLIKRGKVQGKSKSLKKMIGPALSSFCSAMKRLVLTTDFHVLISTGLDEKSADNLFNILKIPKITILAENGNSLLPSPEPGQNISPSWIRISPADSQHIKQAKKIVRLYRNRYSFLSSQFLTNSINITLLKSENELMKDLIDYMIKEIKEGSINNPMNREELDVVLYGRQLIIKDKRLNCANLLSRYIEGYFIEKNIKLEMCVLIGGAIFEPAFTFIQESFFKYFSYEDLDSYTIADKLRISKAKLYIDEKGLDDFLKRIS